MDVYKIRESYADEHSQNLIVGNKKSERILVQKNAKTMQFKAGKWIVVMRDKFIGIQDIAYVCGGSLCLEVRPRIVNEHDCNLIVDAVPGLFDCARMDRAVLKLALMRECKKHKIPVSLAAWKNMKNLLDHGY